MPYFLLFLPHCLPVLHSPHPSNGSHFNQTLEPGRSLQSLGEVAKGNPKTGWCLTSYYQANTGAYPNSLLRFENRGKPATCQKCDTHWDCPAGHCQSEAFCRVINRITGESIYCGGIIHREPNIKETEPWTTRSELFRPIMDKLLLECEMDSE